MVASITYPLGTGQFIAGELSTHEQVHELFTNFTWTAEKLTVEQATIVKHWTTKYTDVFFHLTAFLLFTVCHIERTHVFAHDPNALFHFQFINITQIPSNHLFVRFSH